jgi:hypothetical protein
MCDTAKRCHEIGNIPNGSQDLDLDVARLLDEHPLVGEAVVRLTGGDPEALLYLLLGKGDADALTPAARGGLEMDSCP